MTDFIIRKAHLCDLDGIMDIMEEVRDNPEHPDWFVADDSNFVKEHLDEKGFVVVAETPEGKIAGFFLVKEPEPEENPGTYLDFSTEMLHKVAVMDSAAVGKSYRGHALQGRMLEAAEALIDKKRFSYLMCTVHPDNIFSLRNMQNHGYHVRKTIRCYGGLLRYLLLKEYE